MGPSEPLVGVREGENVTMSCRVKADPAHLEHHHWYRNGHRIDHNQTDMYRELNTAALINVFILFKFFLRFLQVYQDKFLIS